MGNAAGLPFFKAKLTGQVRPMTVWLREVWPILLPEPATLNGDPRNLGSPAQPNVA